MLGSYLLVCLIEVDKQEASSLHPMYAIVSCNHSSLNEVCVCVEYALPLHVPRFYHGHPWPRTVDSEKVLISGVSIFCTQFYLAGIIINVLFK